MPALQVRDFPQGFYEEFRSYSALHHRSMAQQTVAAVDQMLHGSEGAITVSSSVTTRMSKREQILVRAAQRRGEQMLQMPLPDELVRAAREERDEAVGSDGCAAARAVLARSSFSLAACFSTMDA